MANYHEMDRAALTAEKAALEQAYTSSFRQRV